MQKCQKRKLSLSSAFKCSKILSKSENKLKIDFQQAFNFLASVKKITGSCYSYVEKNNWNFCLLSSLCV